ncbi:DUF1516 family protein [Salipaludibacillus sp. CF4.18]|uniref:DUF1516 family protein n=1 Tax=Salipaludibacillus sp. CF4.18 TaxID=3373081 RepID=UPI003EE4FA87
MEHYQVFLHSHSLFWFISIVLFILTVILLFFGKFSMAKVIQMILRVLYILVLTTGVFLIIMNIWWGSILKGLLSFWLIYVMELISNRMAKKQLTSKKKVFFWLQFFIAITVVLYIGFNIS